MFESTFKAELNDIGVDTATGDQLWQEIAFHYTNHNRHYHNVSHLDHLITELSVIRSEITDWQTIVFSIAYHDIIYNVLKHDNEKESASFATERLQILGFSEERISKCRQQILETKKHRISSDSDTNYFTDADLAILGSEPHLYKQYTQQIRKEYKVYPDLLYRPGRKKVLTHFLSMDAIYKTACFAHKYEQTARNNMEHELKELDK